MIGLQEVRQKVRRVIKRRWLHHGLRVVSNNDNHEGLERIYRVQDPWMLDTPREHVRFELCNREIERRVGRVDRVLEIGSGEGLQSAYLLKLCNSLDGVEVSPTAVGRARRSVQGANFYVGDLESQPWALDANRYDLAVACEVLYYVSDVARTLKTMSTVAKACFVTFYSPEAYKLAAVLERIPGVEKTWLSHDGAVWLVAFWRAD